MDSLKELDIVRALSAVELRADDPPEGTLGVMRGHFSVFNTWYEVHSAWEGRFLEQIAPGAFRKTMKENRDAMRVLFDHGMDPHIGNKVLGSITDLREDDTGAYYEVPLYDTSYNRDLLPGLRAGAYGASFRFNVIRDAWNNTPGVSDHNPHGLPERTIKETRTAEFGPVTFPASPTASAAVRCLTDEYYRRLFAADPTRFEALRSQAMNLRTSTIEPAAAAEVDAATQDPSAPAVGHPVGMTPAQRRERLNPLLKGAADDRGIPSPA